MEFSSLRPTSGILTCTVAANRSREPLPTGVSQASARPDPNPRGESNADLPAYPAVTDPSPPLTVQDCQLTRTEFGDHPG
jgi:hypothetical protein